MRARLLPWRSVAIAALFIAISSVAVADKPAAPIARGIALYDDLEYEQAARALGEALAGPALSRASRIAGYQYLGLALVALERENEARDAFRKLLEIDRRFELPETFNPKARDLLEEVRADLASDVRIAEEVAPVPGRADGPVTVTVRLTDPSRATRSVILHYRSAAAKRWSSVQATRTGNTQGGTSWTATISGAFITPPSISYYLVALAADGRPLASAGSAKQPRTLEVEKATPPSRSIFASPWLWAGVGLAAAGGVAAFFLLQPEPTKMGSVLIEPTSPAPL